MISMAGINLIRVVIGMGDIIKEMVEIGDIKVIILILVIKEEMIGIQIINIKEMIEMVDMIAMAVIEMDIETIIDLTTEITIETTIVTALEIKIVLNVVKMDIWLEIAPQLTNQVEDHQNVIFKEETKSLLAIIAKVRDI